MKTSRTVLALFMSMLLAAAPLGVAFAQPVEAADSADLQVVAQDAEAGTDEATEVVPDAEEADAVEGDADEPEGEVGEPDEAGEPEAGEEVVLPTIDLKDCEVQPIEAVTYGDEDEIEPDVTVVYRGKLNPDDTDDATYEYEFNKYDSTYNVELSYSDNEAPGTARVDIKSVDADSDGVVFTGETFATFTIEKAENPMLVSPENPDAIKYKTTKQRIDNPLDVSDEVGDLTFSKVSGKPYFTVEKTTGDIIVAAKTPVGTYKIAIAAIASGDEGTKSESSKNTVTVKVKKAGANSLSVAPAKKKLTIVSSRGLTIAAKKAFKVKKNTFQGKVTYKKTSGNAKIFVSSTGKITVKKGLAKGKTYTVKVRAATAATKNFGAGKTTCTFSVKVK